jgi:hypothetical protein
MMGMVYLITPCLVGYGFMQVVVNKSDERWGVEGKTGRDILEERRRNKAIQSGQDPDESK